jgi:Holliday junction resolvasome RuvABC endonuclease subunit
LKRETILGIDPGAREMGLAVLRDREPRYFGVRTLRDGTRPYDVIGQSKRIVLEAVEEHQPRVVAIERPFKLPTRRSRLLNVLADELRARESELGLKVVLLAPEEIRRRVTGNPRATRTEVAEHLARSGFDPLSTLIASRASRAAPAPGPRDKYWLPMFDALAVALAARDLSLGNTPGDPAPISRICSGGID